MVYWIAIIYFLVVMYLLGLSVALLTKFKGKDLFEDIVMKLGIGLGAFPLLSIILNWFGLIDWKIIFVISLITPLAFMWIKKPESKEKKEFKFKLKKTHIYYLIILVLFAATLFVYAKGSFIYPYLENGDPLSHALSTKYIQETGTYSTPADARITHYLEPYPPFFPALMSTTLSLAQQDTIWNLKFFNVLIISLGTLFMFFLVKKLTKSNTKGAVGAFLLLAINSYVSHFIFSAGYATTMIIPAIYFLINAEEKHEKISKKNNFKWFDFKKLDWKSVILAAVMISSVFLIQPITSAILALFLLIHFLINIRKSDRTKAVFFVILIGLILSQLFWIPTISKYGLTGTAEVLGFQMFLPGEAGVDNDSSGGIIYSFNDFMIAPIANKIDQPTGIGTVLFLAFLVAAVFIILKLKNIVKSNETNSRYTLSLLIWTALLIFLIEGNAFTVKFVPHRLWAYFSIGVVLITIIGLSFFTNGIKSKYIKIGLVILFVIGVSITSLAPKYQVQTSYWPPGPEWKSQEELQGYLTMANQIPRNTKVYAFCSRDEKAASSNMGVVFNDEELIALKNNLTKMTDPGYPLSAVLYNKEISYLIIDSECVVKHGINNTNNVLQSLSSRSFIPSIQNNGFFLLRVP